MDYFSTKNSWRGGSVFSLKNLYVLWAVIVFIFKDNKVWFYSRKKNLTSGGKYLSLGGEAREKKHFFFFNRVVCRWAFKKKKNSRKEDFG